MSGLSESHEDDRRMGLVENAIHTYSRPSELKITDMRLAVAASIYDYPILRLDTNQGGYGLGGQPSPYEYELGRGWRAPGSGPGARLTERGIARAVEVVKAAREAAGWEASLCTAHFGHGYLTAKEVIRLAEAFEPFNLAWI